MIVTMVQLWDVYHYAWFNFCYDRDSKDDCRNRCLFWIIFIWIKSTRNHYAICLKYSLERLSRVSVWNLDFDIRDSTRFWKQMIECAWFWWITVLLKMTETFWSDRNDFLHGWVGIIIQLLSSISWNGYGYE